MAKYTLNLLCCINNLILLILYFLILVHRAVRAYKVILYFDFLLVFFVLINPYKLPYLFIRLLSIPFINLLRHTLPSLGGMHFDYRRLLSFVAIDGVSIFFKIILIPVYELLLEIQDYLVYSD